MVAGRTRGGVLVLVAIVLVAVNLRAAVTSLGALLDEVSVGIGLSHTAAGVMTSLPVVAFAAFGAVTPRLSARFGAPALLFVAMGLLATGQAVRAMTPSVPVFVVSSAAALGGVAVANVLLPGLVRQYFPDRVGSVTGLYSMTMIFGSAVAAGTAVPIAHAAGSWRAGIGVWAVLAVIAMIALYQARPALRRPARTLERPDGGGVAVRPSRTRVGWALAVFFGLQSMSGFAIMGWLPQLYRDAGFSAETAGLLLAAMIAGSVIMAFVLPVLAAGRSDQRPLVLALAGSMLIAYVGLAVAPHAGAIVWTVLLAIGQGAFPLALSLIGVRARTPAGVIALSAFAQSAGYLIAVAGPLAVGVLYEATGGWYAALGVLLVAMVIQAIAGLAASRPRTLEDE